MDKEFLVGCITAMSIVAIVVAGIIFGMKVDYNTQIQFAQICTSHGKGVQYREVNGNTVSECR